ARTAQRTVPTFAFILAKHPSGLKTLSLEAPTLEKGGLLSILPPGDASHETSEARCGGTIFSLLSAAFKDGAIGRSVLTPWHETAG
ncbi:MAG: hypothetical protein ABI651_12535, partial [Verrucomicrobiota bacterium]